MRHRWIVLVLILAAVLPLSAQRGGRRPQGGGYRMGGYVPGLAASPYDAKFAFVRLWYPMYPGWSYDYPEMEQNLNQILDSITEITPSPSGGNIFKMDDPELLKFPIAYLSEPGYWYPSDAEVQGLRTYIAKGGFLIVDDFHYQNEWNVFEAAMTRVLPKGKIIRLQVSHPIFNTFFAIKTLDVPYPGQLGQQGLMGEFYGIHENNDPRKPLQVVINYNIDLGDYVEWSADTLYDPLSTNEAYKFMVNYIIYGMTH